MQNEKEIAFSFYILAFILIYSFSSRIIIFYLQIPNILNLSLFPLIVTLYFFKPMNGQNTYQQKNNLFLYIFFFICSISNLINDISFSNLFLFLIVFCFPFFLLRYQIQIDKNKFYINKINSLLFTLMILNNITSLIQYFIFGYRVDDIKGIFIEQGLGHHINGAINFFYSIYHYGLYRDNLKIKNILIILICLFITFISDTKTIIFATLVCIMIIPVLILLSRIFITAAERKNILLPSIFYLILMLVLAIFILKFVQITVIGHVNYDYLKDGFTVKYNFFKLIDNSSLIDFLFGKGAAMVTSKLAIMSNLSNRYDYFLDFLNFTKSDLTYYINKIEVNNFYSNPSTGSSLFQLTFSHGSIFAEVGLVGLLVYTLLIYNLFKFNYLDYFSIVLSSSIYLLGFVFTWLEESIFISFIMIVLICYKNKDLIVKKNF